MYICMYTYIPIYMEYIFLFIYIYIYSNLLEWLTGCGLPSSAMTGYEQKVPESRTWSVHKAGCLSWSSVDAGILKEWAVMPGKERACQQSKESRQ